MDGAYEIVEGLEETQRGSPVYINCISKGIPFPLHDQPKVLTTKEEPYYLIDCNDSFARYLGWENGMALFASKEHRICLKDIVMPNSFLRASTACKHFVENNIRKYERLCAYKGKNGNALYCSMRKELMETHAIAHITEYFVDRPLCLFTSWLKTFIPQAVVQGCQRTHCQCKITVS